MDDTKRLDWLEKQDGYALVSDDGGRWACTCEGMQNVPEADPTEIITSFFIPAHEWKNTIRKAIDGAMAWGQMAWGQDEEGE